MLIRFDFLEHFLPVSQKMHIRISSEEIGRVVRSVPFPRLRNSDKTSHEKIDVCRHGFTCILLGLF